MARWIGLAVDPTPGGTTYDLINADTDPVEIPDPSIWVPFTTATASAGSNNLDRNNEGRGRRAQSAPIAFSASPRASFESRAYPGIVKPIVSRALSGIGAGTGTAPAAITTPIEAVQSNPLKTLAVHLLREEQYDVLTGVAVNNFELNLAADQEGTINLSDARGLYHDVTDDLPDPLPTPTWSHLGDTYKLRDAVAYVGETRVKIDCLAGFTLSWSNGLIDDFQSRFCAGENVREYTLGGKKYRIWLPKRHKIGPQAVTGTLNFGVTRPDLETRRILADAQRFEIVCSAGPISPATTPAADEVMKITMYRQVFTDGGADPLVRDGDIKSSYTFGAFADPTTGQDVRIEFVSNAAVV